MKLTIKNIYKKISNLPDEMRFNKLKKHSAEPDFTEFHELAECYHKGIGTRRNYKQALKWYIKEAVTGNADAQYELGMRYWKGEKLVGGEQNESEAMRWIEMAANTGNKRAKAFLDKNVFSDPVKLQEKMGHFDFCDINKTKKFIVAIPDQNKRNEFVSKAMAYYKETGNSKSAIDLVIYISSDYKLDLHTCKLSELFEFKDEVKDFGYEKEFEDVLIQMIEKADDVIEVAEAYEKINSGNTDLRQRVLQKIECLIEYDEYDCPDLYDGYSVWGELPIGTRHAILYRGFCEALQSDDLDWALSCYVSDDFSDFGNEGDAENELNELIDEESIFDVVEIVEEYAGSKRIANLDLDNIYYRAGSEAEKDEKMELAYKYYKKAAEMYGNADARARLKELYS
jgi:TPR repeat protein